MKRRFFLFAAPAVVAAPSLMKISALAMPPEATYARYSGYDTVALSFDDLLTATLRTRMAEMVESQNSLLMRLLYDSAQST